MNCLRLFILLIVAVLAGCASNQTSQYANKKVYTAEETSRTIDLTHPPRDMWDRIRRGFAIPNLHSDLADQWTEYYASHPEAVYRMSQRASKYLYFIVDELERRGMPTELALLPFVESAYNPTAYSKSNASGLWQFIPSTGLHYNLQQDSWRDQRRDPIASTHAALDYLSYLYDFQGDWYLALASYNWGEGAVKRSLDKNADAGLPTDYASISMPDETRNYVPKLQAIKNIVANPKKYGITLPSVSNTPYFTTIKRTQSIDVAVAAQLAEMSVEDFKALNASFNRPVILGEHEPTLLLPTDRADIFKANLEAYQGKLSSWQAYHARQGESYAAIAKKYGISLASLRKINGLSSKKTRAIAQTLLVPKLESGGGIQLASLEYPSNDSGSETRKPSIKKVSVQRRGKDVVVVKRKANVRTHTVQSGDTLYSLAKRYHTSIDELRKLNNLKSNSLARGKQLRVPGTNIRG
ncbi:MAG TPA: transglycosylase SLT domain-containing protein [Eoetvoesiella sp.]|uniref:transglycosylase SLT domain-containing protein n=1 Tax=Eoetvoesiella sp. TaxID=1966355 RepID=UPI002CFB74DC|nr:transglycosylase SLT domain-containing protein [Eoetvoesiella sp.]HWK61945.1 transglycosylase SLT domain-containing protein [Eoetvoesiella sp.]